MIAKWYYVSLRDERNPHPFRMLGNVRLVVCRVLIFFPVRSWDFDVNLPGDLLRWATRCFGFSDVSLHIPKKN